jgi:hypothetical protein
MPFNGVINSVYATFGVPVAYTFPSGITVYPYIQLYSAPAGANTFTPLSQTMTATTQGFSGATVANTLRTAGSTQTTGTLPAGTRILITGGMRVTSSGTATVARSDYFYFTGGVGIKAMA